MAWTVIRDRDGNNPAYFKDGEVATKEEFDAAFPPKELGVPGGTRPSTWPMESVALGVHPNQVEAARARNKAAGINVDYTPEGKAVIPDNGARKAILKAAQMHDNAGFY